MERIPINHRYWVLKFLIPGFEATDLIVNDKIVGHRHDIGGDGGVKMYQEGGYHVAISEHGQEIRVANTEVMMTMN